MSTWRIGVATGAPAEVVTPILRPETWTTPATHSTSGAQPDHSCSQRVATRCSWVASGRYSGRSETARSRSSSAALVPGSRSRSGPGTRSAKTRMPCTEPTSKPAPATSPVTSSAVKRRPVRPVVPESSRRASAWATWPAMARAMTAACRCATSRESRPPGRSTSWIAASAAAGSSTTSSTPWQSATSASSTRAERSERSPCRAVTSTPTSRARRASAASASGLGSTTVTRWPSPATRTAKPPVPPPMSRTLSPGWSGPDSSSMEPSDSHTTAVRALSRRSLADMTTTLGLGSSRTAGAAVPELAGDVLGVLTGRPDVGVGGHREAAGVDQHPAAAHAAGRVGTDVVLGVLPERLRAGHHRPGGARLGGTGAGVFDADRAEPLRHHRQPLVHRLDPLAVPERGQHRQLPAAGGPQRDAAVARTAELAADHEQPGVEDGGGVGALGVLEEGRVHWPRRVVEGQEDDPASGADRRGLGGDLDPGDQQLGLAPLGQEVVAADHPELVEEGRVGVDDVPAGVEAEDLELGLHPLLGRQLGQPRDLALRGLVAELEGELDRVDRRRGRSRLRLRRRPRPHPGVAERVPLELAHARALPRVGAVAGGGVVGHRPGAGPGPAAPGRPRSSASRAAGQPAAPGAPGPLDRLAVPLELSDLEQQVAPGHPSAAVHPVGTEVDAVDRVEAAGQHQPLDHGPGDVGAVPEVGEGVERPGRHDPVHLAVVDPLHLGQ